MVAFPEKRRKERREGHHAGQNPRKGPKGSKEQIKARVKELLERLMRRSWPCTLRNIPPRLTGTTPEIFSPLLGPLEDLKVPRVRDGKFHP